MSMLTDFYTESRALIYQATIYQLHSLSFYNPRNEYLDSSFTDEVPGPKTGEMALQGRVWCEGWDTTVDSNARHEIANAEFVVLRDILNAYDESLYVVYMLDSQAAATDPHVWRALPSVYDLQDPGPAINAAPERRGNLLQYTVTVSALLNSA